jgi:hypothetical protein
VVGKARPHEKTDFQELSCKTALNAPPHINGSRAFCKMIPQRPCR